MKAMQWLLVLCVAWAVPALAVDNPAKSFVFGVDVNTSGQVTATYTTSDKDKPIAQILDFALKQWRFIPALRDGKAVPVHTFIAGTIEALPGKNGKGEVRVTYRRHGPGWNSSSMPHYPEESVRQRKTALVAMTGTVQPDGKLTDIEVHSWDGNWASGPEGSQSPMVKSAVDWFKKSDFTPETLGGQPVAAQIRHFIRFNLHDSRGSDEDDPPLAAEEWRVLKQAGFKDSDNGKQPQAPETSSVLQTSDVHPVIIQF